MNACMDLGLFISPADLDCVHGTVCQRFDGSHIGVLAKANWPIGALNGWRYARNCECVFGVLTDLKNLPI